MKEIEVYLVIPPHPSPENYPAVEIIATVTSVLTEHTFCESLDRANNSQISNTFQESDCLLKLIKVNNQVVPTILLNGNVNHTAQSIICKGGGIILWEGLDGERKGKTERVKEYLKFEIFANIYYLLSEKILTE